jgi:folate-binding protein YgfZ
MTDLAITPLDDLAVLSVRGADARSFLQGQVSNDMELLDDRPAILTGVHNPQGRCLSVLRLLQVEPGQILMAVPADLAAIVAAHLSKFVFRARVRIENASDQWRIYGATGPDAEAAASTRFSMAMDAGGMRQLIVAPRPEALPDGDTQARASWRLDDIVAGLPEINAATSGLFTAQMLNLDLIGAVSFSKGCYTGQEIIARAHYLGQVKRRMQRFYADDLTPLQPGARLTLADGRRAQVVIASEADGGGQEMLAVTSLGVHEMPDEVTSGEAAVTAQRRLRTEQLGLPYSL